MSGLGSINGRSGEAASTTHSAHRPSIPVISTLVLLTGVALGTPVTLRAGLKLTDVALTDVYAVDTSYYYNYTVLYEDYVGICGELLAGALVRGLYLRVELAEFRFYTQPSLGRGRGLNILANLDADVLYVLPVGRKVSPLVYAGLGYERYYNKPPRDVRASFPDYEIRAGLGVDYRPIPKLSLFAEAQLLTWYMHYMREIDDPNIVRAIAAGIIGYPKVWAGVRYTL